MSPDNEQLAQVFQQEFPVTTFMYFYMYDNQAVTALESYVFNLVTFEYFFVSGTNIDTISPYALDASKDILYYMYIYGGNLNEVTFPFDHLDQYPILRYLSVLYQDIQWIPPMVSNSIRSLDFKNSSISGIANGKY